MPLPQTRQLSAETLLRMAFPDLIDEAIWTCLDDLRSPIWTRQDGWVQHVPPWLHNNWKNLSMPERTIAYIFCRQSQMNED